MRSSMLLKLVYYHFSRSSHIYLALRLAVPSMSSPSEMPSIDDSQCILITGATSGIGRALGQALVNLPSKPRVIGTGRRQERLEELGKMGVEPLYWDMLANFDDMETKVDELIETNPDVSCFC